MNFKELPILAIVLLFGSVTASGQTQDSYQGFHIGQSLGEMFAVGGGDLSKAQATCANPPKQASKEQNAYLTNICDKIGRALTGQPVEFEYPKSQVRVAFNQGRIVRVTDFNGVIRLQENQGGPQAPATRQAQIQSESQISPTVSAQKSISPPPQAATTPKPPAKSTTTAKVVPINDAFAKAGLRALRAIQGDATLPDVTQGGEILFSKAVVDAIDAADSEARTDEETRMSEVLRALHIQHSTNNMKIAAMEELKKAGHQYSSTSDLGREIETRALLEKDPEIAAMRSSPKFQNEEACAIGLESLFRARKGGPIPGACSSSNAE